MRVAVRHPARTEPDGTPVAESVSPYHMGRIEDFVNPVTGETTPKDEVAKLLLGQAKAEFPDCEVYLERLVHNGDAEGEDPHGEGGTSTWVHHEEVPEGAHSPKGGVIAARELTTEQSQEAGQ